MFNNDYVILATTMALTLQRRKPWPLRFGSRTKVRTYATNAEHLVIHDDMENTTPVFVDTVSTATATAI